MLWSGIFTRKLHPLLCVNKHRQQDLQMPKRVIVAANAAEGAFIGGSSAYSLSETPEFHPLNTRHASPGVRQESRSAGDAPPD